MSIHFDTIPSLVEKTDKETVRVKQNIDASSPLDSQLGHHGMVSVGENTFSRGGQKRDGFYIQFQN